MIMKAKWDRKYLVMFILMAFNAYEIQNMYHQSKNKKSWSWKSIEYSLLFKSFGMASGKSHRMLINSKFIWSNFPFI